MGGGNRDKQQEDKRTGQEVLVGRAFMKNSSNTLSKHSQSPVD